MPWFNPGGGGAATQEQAMDRVADLEFALGSLLKELSEDGDPSRKEQACTYAEMIYARDIPSTPKVVAGGGGANLQGETAPGEIQVHVIGRW